MGARRRARRQRRVFSRGRFRLSVSQWSPLARPCLRRGDAHTKERSVLEVMKVSRVQWIPNNCKPNRNAAVCADTPLLAMMGRICTVAPVFAIRRNAVPPVRFQNAQECNVWRRLSSSGGRQAGIAQRARRQGGRRPW